MSRFSQEEILKVETRVPFKPQTEILIPADQIIHTADGPMYGKSMLVAMGEQPKNLSNDEDYVIVSTSGGLRDKDGKPVAYGYHTGHWELDKAVEEAARTITALGGRPRATKVSDVCDGVTMGTDGMMDSLAFRNTAACTMGSQIRSMPTRKGVMGVATCDKGLPATMMALASERDLPSIIVPGGVALPTEDAPEMGEAFAKVGVHGAHAHATSTMMAHGKLNEGQAQDLLCNACGTPGGGCQFLGTAATAQVVAEALGMSLPHSALTPSSQPIWLDMAARSAEALVEMRKKGITTKDILTEKSVHNAMVVHAAFGGSTNLLMHIPAIAHAGGVKRPTKEQWEAVNRSTPRLVDVLPNTDKYTTVHAFMAGGVPEAMLHLRDMGLLHLDVMTVTGKTLGENLTEWEKSPRRAALRERLQKLEGFNPDDIICSAEQARAKGMTGTLTLPTGNLMPEGSVIKSTAIDRSVLTDGVYHRTHTARVFTSEEDVMDALLKRKRKDGTTLPPIKGGDVIVLIGYGPIGRGMPEILEITQSLKYHPEGKHIAVLTDGRFSGVSTGACVGHIPEALAGGPIGKIRDGDQIDIHLDCKKMEGHINFVGTDPQNPLDPKLAEKILEGRALHRDVKPHPKLPNDVRTWALNQDACGGVWGGCVVDAEIMAGVHQAAKRAASQARTLH